MVKIYLFFVALFFCLFYGCYRNILQEEQINTYVAIHHGNKINHALNSLFK